MEKHTNDLTLTQEIAGYCRISVDEELDRDNTSIENQKKIIDEFVKAKFPKCKLSIYEDRDRSGYTFEIIKEIYAEIESVSGYGKGKYHFRK